MANLVRVAIIGDNRSLHTATSGAEKDLDSFSGKAGKAGTSIGSAFGKVAKAAALGGVAVAALAVTAGTVMVRAGDKLNEATDLLNTSLANQHLNITAGDAAIKAHVTEFQKWGITQEALTQGATMFVNVGASVKQSLTDTALAANIAAGRHIALSAAEALVVKVQTGHVSLLGRYGIATKDATGKTISSGEAMTRLSKIYGGDATTASKSLGGQVAALKAWFENLTATLGQKLIPIVMDVEAWLGKKLPPVFKVIGEAIRAVSDYVKDHWPAIIAVVHKVGAAFTEVGGKIWDIAKKVGTTVASAFQWLLAHQDVLKAVVVGLGAVLVAMFTMWAVNAAIAAVATIAAALPVILLVAAVALLAAGVFYAYEHFSAFHDVVDAVANFVKTKLIPAFVDIVKFIATKVVPTVISIAETVAHVVGTVGMWIGKIIGFVAGVIDWITGHWKLILAIVTGPIGAAVLIIATHWNAIRNGAATVITDIKNFFTGIPAFIMGLGPKFLSAASTMGTAILNGIKSGIGAAASFVANIAGDIKDLVNKYLIDPIRNVEIKWGGFHGVGKFDIKPFGAIPRLHEGGVFNSGMGEGLALLKDGEGVFTARQMAALHASPAHSSAVTINMPHGVDPAAVVTAQMRYTRRNGY